MARADLLVVRAGQLVTLRGPPGPRHGRRMRQLGIVKNGAVAIRDGRILDVGLSRLIRRKYSARVVVDAEGATVMPGLVDAHTHLPFAGSRAFELPLKLEGRTYFEILRAGGGIHRTVKDTRRAPLSSIVRGVEQALGTMLAWGTTTAEAKSGYGLSAVGELKQLRAIREASGRQPVELVPTFLGAHVVPREYAHRRAAYVRLLVDELIPRVARGRLAEFCDAFLERNAFTGPECVRILRTARRWGMRTKLHADEFTNQKGAELAAREGSTSADHLLHVSPRGIRALARSSTVAVLLPGVSVTSFLDRFAPARALMDGGAAVALGTDYNPNCPVLSMPSVMQWAVYHLRLHPAEAISAATFNAAYAVGRGDRIGSLQPLKQADLLVMREEDPLELFYRLGRNPVRFVIKKGRVFAAPHGVYPSK